MAGAKAAKTDRSLPLHWWWHVFEPAAPARPALLALRARRHGPSKAGLAGAAGSKSRAFENRPCWRCGLEDMRLRKPALLALRARRHAPSKAGLAGAAGSKTCALESRPCWRCGLEEMRHRVCRRAFLSRWNARRLCGTGSVHTGVLLGISIDRGSAACHQLTRSAVAPVPSR